VRGLAALALHLQRSSPLHHAVDAVGRALTIGLAAPPALCPFVSMQSGGYSHRAWPVYRHLRPQQALQSALGISIADGLQD